MSKCLHCGFDNYPHAYVCANCYAVLRPSDAYQHSSTFSMIFPKPAPASSHLNVDLNKLDKRTLVLYISELSEPAILRIIQTAFLGRASENYKVHPLLDLTPFDASTKGVSRVHAAIYRTETGMAIEDRDSSNGTWLNGIRLEPRKLYKLASGDHLFLAKLPMEVYIGQGELDTVARLAAVEIITQELDKPSTPGSTVVAKDENSSAEIPPEPNDPKRSSPQT